MSLPPIPMYGGMLDLTPPVARCCSCGWEGVPSYRQGQAQTECGRCEGARDEDAEWLELFEAIWRDPAYRRMAARGVNPPLFRIKRRVDYRGVARNAMCPCGSGVKFKKCHGR